VVQILSQKLTTTLSVIKDISQEESLMKIS